MSINEMDMGSMCVTCVIRRNQLNEINILELPIILIRRRHILHLHFAYTYIDIHNKHIIKTK